MPIPVSRTHTHTKPGSSSSSRRRSPAGRLHGGDRVLALTMQVEQDLLHLDRIARDARQQVLGRHAEDRDPLERQIARSIATVSSISRSRSISRDSTAYLAADRPQPLNDLRGSHGVGLDVGQRLDRFGRASPIRRLDHPARRLGVRHDRRQRLVDLVGDRGDQPPRVATRSVCASSSRARRACSTAWQSRASACRRRCRRSTSKPAISALCARTISTTATTCQRCASQSGGLTKPEHAADGQLDSRRDPSAAVATSRRWERCRRERAARRGHRPALATRGGPPSRRRGRD